MNVYPVGHDAFITERCKKSLAGDEVAALVSEFCRASSCAAQPSSRLALGEAGEIPDTLRDRALLR